MGLLDKAKQLADKDKLKKVQEQAKAKIDEVQQKRGAGGSKEAEQAPTSEPGDAQSGS